MVNSVINVIFTNKSCLLPILILLTPPPYQVKTGKEVESIIGISHSSTLIFSNGFLFSSNNIK